MKWILLILMLLAAGYSLQENKSYAIGSIKIMSPGSGYILEINSAEETHMDLYEQCNSYPEKYNNFKGKIIPYTCTACKEESWTIYGDSMLPTLSSGTGLVMSAEFVNLSVGMIVNYDPRMDLRGSTLDMETAKKYNYNIIHRIVAVMETGYIIKGDNNSVCELIPREAIKQVLLYTVR